MDGSANQLASAQPHPRVQYVCAVAEELPVDDHSVSLVAAAQAVHWFDFERFNAECRRVLAPDGVVAVWTYEKFRATPAVDAVMDRFYYEVVGPYWPPERRYVDEGYRTLPFPWREATTRHLFHCATTGRSSRCLVTSPRGRPCCGFAMRIRATTRLLALRAQLATHWPVGGTLRLVWPIHLRLGRA